MHNWLFRLLLGLGALVAAASIGSPSQGSELQITVTNDQPSGGFSVGGVWFGVQNGSFTPFTQGGTASSQISTLAQTGNTAPLAALFTGNGPETTLTSGNSVTQFLPGQSNSTTLSVSNPSADQFLSYAAMVVPSNDFFLGNATPLQIFNSSGAFIGPVTIQVFGSNIWDSDTEVQSTTSGLTFVVGQTPGGGTQISGGSIAPLFSEAGAPSFLQSIEGLSTIGGYTVTSDFGPTDLIATFQINSVPEPTSVVMLGIGAAALLVSRRRARSRKS
jgi:hypothetical protein